MKTVWDLRFDGNSEDAEYHKTEKFKKGQDTDEETRESQSNEYNDFTMADFVAVIYFGRNYSGKIT